MIDAVIHDLDSSIRRSCRILGFNRDTYGRRKKGYRPDEVDQHIADLLHRTTERFVAWGFWMVFFFLRNTSQFAYNHKRVYRVWCDEKLNLRLPPKRTKIHRVYQELLSPAGINEGWAMDFVSDWIVGPSQKQIRVINIIDEGSRRALWTEAYQSISAKTLIRVLDNVVDYRGKPAYIRCDNGPEFISKRLQAWARRHQIELRFIQPGKPTQNGLKERLNKTLRVECLDLTWLRNLELLNEELQAWSQTYNVHRPHKSLGRISPEQYENQNQKFYYSVA